MAVKVSLKELIEAGAHFGHQTKRWNPKMEEYLYGAQEGVHVFDLTKTKEKLEEALEILKTATKEGKKILLVCTKKQAKDKAKEVAEATGVFYVTERWLGGTLTNFEQINKSLKKLKEMKEKMAAGEYG
ncbi:MAG: 30S ribosomal protein S2, partial [Microgenomates group bacterium]